MGSYFCNQIKEYFIKNPNNYFIEELSKNYEIQEIQVYPEDEDDIDVIVNLKEKQNSISSIVFTDDYAFVEYSFLTTFISIPFYYHKLSVFKNYDLVGIFSKYEQKGIDALLKDILKFIKYIINNELCLEYIDINKDQEDPDLSICRIYHQLNGAIAHSLRWNKKYTLYSEVIKLIL